MAPRTLGGRQVRTKVEEGQAVYRDAYQDTDVLHATRRRGRRLLLRQHSLFKRHRLAFDIVRQAHKEVLQAARPPAACKSVGAAA